MNRAHFVLWMVVLVLASSFSMQGQQAAPPGLQAAAAAVPTLVQFGGTLTDASGKPLTGVVGVSFLLYKEQQGGAPLWMETQNVQASKSGHYSVMLGATSSAGLPADLFAQGEARWLGVQAQGQEEQPRVMLLSVPYALKAGDAATLGGLPASAFVLAGAAANSSATGSGVSAPLATNSSAASSVTATASGVTTNGGKANTIPMFSTATDIENSILTQTGTTAINVGGKLNLPSIGTATALGGKNSQPQMLAASSFNSGTAKPVAQTFQWQAEPTGNNTATPSGTLNLLFALGNGASAETGFSINNKGIVTFAPGQTLPVVTGNESVTGNLSASGQLISNVTTGTPPLAVKSSTMVTNLNANLLGGLSSSAFAQLGAANIFTKTQTINANLALPQTTGASSGVITLAGASFVHGFGDTTNAFLGPLAGGGFQTTGFSDTGVGNNALFSNTSGTNNTAVGACALCNSTAGMQNTALGALSGFNVTNGSNLTLIGYSAGTNGIGGLTNATAVGAGAQVGSSNALVLGGTGASAVNVGIGTPTPLSTLDVAGLQHTLIGNTGCGSGFGGIGFGASGLADCTHYSLLGEGVHTYLNRPAGGQMLFREGNTTEMVLAPGGSLGIGTASPAAQLEVDATSLIEVFHAIGFNAANGSNSNGGGAITAIGGNGDQSDPNGTVGGNGITAFGGGGGDNLTGNVCLFFPCDGVGGSFTGGLGNGGLSVGGDGILSTPGSGFAGNFNGDINVTGAVLANTKDFKMDHPLDPANKYLFHASVESSEMMNIYTGNVTTDAQGEATVRLPDWFEALNTDFRYQLTAIGQFAQAIISHKIQNSQFQIRTNAPNVEVSWQVTGVRQDPYAKAHPLVVEQEKEPGLKGFYIRPELYGQPDEKQIEWARHPRLMKQIKEVRARQLAASQKSAIRSR